MDIADFEGWLHRTANAMTSATDHDDLVQEGRIAIWKALQRADLSDPGLPGYLTRAAKGRMIEITTGTRRQTGHVAPEGKIVTNDKGRETRARIRAFIAEHPGASGADIARGTGLSAATVSGQRKKLDQDTEIAPPGSIEAIQEAGADDVFGYDHGLLDMIVEAYMYGQIQEALSVLTPNERRYVHLRFWEGYQKSELVAAFGYDPSAIWPSARERLRPVLEELLAA